MTFGFRNILYARICESKREAEMGECNTRRGESAIERKKRDHLVEVESFQILSIPFLLGNLDVDVCTHELHTIFVSYRIDFGLIYSYFFSIHY